MHYNWDFSFLWQYRTIIAIGLAVFATGNLLCGASVDVPSLAAARLVEGIGKGMTIGLYREPRGAFLASVRY